MRNRHVKFGWKIPIHFGNIATSPQGGIFFDSHCTYTCIIVIIIYKMSSSKKTSQLPRADYACDAITLHLFNWKCWVAGDAKKPKCFSVHCIYTWALSRAPSPSCPEISLLAAGSPVSFLARVRYELRCGNGMLPNRPTDERTASHLSENTLISMMYVRYIR